MVSIIIPCYNEADGIPAFFADLTTSLYKISEQIELVFVDDGSTDNTLTIIKQLPSHGKVVIRYISFSRNFGKESAILAGLQAAAGNYIAVIDADMQDDPTLLISMYDAIHNKGVDCAVAKRCSRIGEPFLRSVSAKLFYKLIRQVSGLNIVDGERDYRMVTRQVLDAVLSLHETTRFSKGLFAWVGFNTIWLEEEYRERTGGKTKWSFRKLCSYAINALECFSTAPWVSPALLGGSLSFLSICCIILAIVKCNLYSTYAYEWFILLGVVLLILGIQFLNIGILGQYISKTILEVRKRPPYIIREQSDESSKE